MVAIEHLQGIDGFCEWIYAKDREKTEIVQIIQCEVLTELAPENVAYIIQLLEIDDTQIDKKREKIISTLGGYRSLDMTLNLAKKYYPPLGEQRA